MIQKSYCHFSCNLRVFYLCSIFLLYNCCIRMDFACFMKLWPFILKSFHVGMAFRLLKSFLWLFNLQLNGLFGFPTRALARKIKLLTFYWNWKIRQVFTKGCQHGWWQNLFFGTTHRTLENAIHGKEMFQDMILHST